MVRALTLKNKEFFAKGKRGITYLASWRGQRVLVKEHNPEADIDTISHEADMLQLLYPFGIGPQFFAFDKRNRALIREFIDGEEIEKYLNNSSKKEILSVLAEIFYQCRTLDLLGINKLELTRPYKHILITKKASPPGVKPSRKKGAVLQIDFERCKKTEKPKNVTQFTQCVARGRLQSIFKEKNIIINAKNILALAGKYKRKYDILIFEQLIKEVSGSPRKYANLSFNEQVYDACSRVPEGRVITYRGLAQALNSKAYQAIGQALKRNPYAPRVPCHRVIKNDGAIGGFMGKTSGATINKKKELLAKEGVFFDQKGQITDKKCIIEFE